MTVKNPVPADIGALPVDLSGKRVIVTAGAAGIGAAIAGAFAARGARVHVCDVDEQALAACPHPHSRADVSRRDEIERYMDDALSRLGGLDVLVNNAGIAGPTAGIGDIAPQDLDATLDINLAAQFHTVRHALPALREAGGGSIINISSVAGRMGVPMRTPYAATKWGVVGLTRSHRPRDRGPRPQHGRDGGRGNPARTGWRQPGAVRARGGHRQHGAVPGEPLRRDGQRTGHQHRRRPAIAAVATARGLRIVPSRTGARGHRRSAPGA
jgi:NAD(P)-dependent dehydrogenase (short-subunit alcohol dehydrogenase family)